MSDIDDMAAPEGATTARDPPTYEETGNAIYAAFASPFDHAAHIKAIDNYVRWLAQTITEQVPDEKYNLAVAVVEAVQLEELRAAIGGADKVAKELRESYAGYFAQYLQDQKLENAKVSTSLGNRLIYKRSTISFSIDDPISLTNHLINNPNDMQLLTLKLAAEPTREFMKQHNGALPPGASSYSETKAHLRRST